MSAKEEAELKRVKLTVAYEGTAYAGWQIQKNAVSVEEVLNGAISELVGEDITVIGASRTDAGVHALGNVAVFDTESRIPADKFSYALNERLPEDIRIQGSCEVAPDFHPRYCESVKTYEYCILNHRFQIPAYRHNTYFYHRPLDVEAMQRAACILVGEHDFASFCSAHAQVRDTVRTVCEIQVRREAPLVRIRVSGTGFLYNMVRIIAGTLIQVGIGRLSDEDVRRILDSRDRNEAGPCAPAIGLTLIGIEYRETLSRQLLVSNDKMFYCFVQKDIPVKQQAYLIVYWCQPEELAPLIARMTKKAFRLGARRLLVRHDGDVILPDVLGASRRNTYSEGVFFTAGDYRYVLDNKVIQMDRDLRAYPPQQGKVEIAAVASDCDFVLLTREREQEFLQLYNQCFYSVPCALSYDDEDMAALFASADRNGYLLLSGQQAVGVCIVGNSAEDADALELYAIGVFGRCRRKGYARMMLEQVAQMAVDCGKKRVTLQVSDVNTKALRLYEQSGYDRIRERHVWYSARRTRG